MMHQSLLHEPVEIGGHTFSAIALEDLPRLSSACERASTSLWASYPPFLLSYGQSQARAVLVGEVDAALVILLRRKVRGRDHLDLVIPPLSQRSRRAYEAYASFLNALLSLNGPDAETRLLWSDLQTAEGLSHWLGWRTRLYDREYLYGRRAVLAMEGERFRTLRKRINRCEREVAPEARPYAPNDHDACVQLLKEWQDRRQDIVGPVLDFAYTRAALDLAADIPERFMTGIVLEVAGGIRAFAFGGPIRPGVGQFFLLKSDPAIRGLAESARVALIGRLDGCDLINDAGDLGRPGLRQHKEMFGPVGFVPTWKASFACQTSRLP